MMLPVKIKPRAPSPHLLYTFIRFAVGIPRFESSLGSQVDSRSVIAAFINLFGAVLSANSKCNGLPSGEASTCSAGRRAEPIMKDVLSRSTGRSYDEQERKSGGQVWRTTLKERERHGGLYREQKWSRKHAMKGNQSMVTRARNCHRPEYLQLVRWPSANCLEILW